MYPYAFHPAGRQVTVSLRYSCPSVVANLGTALTANKAEIRKIERLVVPESAAKTPAPQISARQQLDWADFQRFVEALDATLAHPAVPFTRKLLQSLTWIELVGQARFDKIRGERLDDFLDVVSGAAVGDVPDDLAHYGMPHALARTQFRLLVAQYARKDTSVELRSGWRGRWKLLRAAAQFARGRGVIPPLQEQFAAVPFEAVERPFGPLPVEADELFTRYFRVKIQGLHFCGPAYYGVPLVEGFQSLALIYPATLWLGRWLAAGEARVSLSLGDIQRALATADHHHGYSPIFGERTFRSRVRTLALNGDIQRLCAWYAGGTPMVVPAAE